MKEKERGEGSLALPSSVDSIGSCSSSARMEQYVLLSLLLLFKANPPSPSVPPPHLTSKGSTRWTQL